MPPTDHIPVYGREKVFLEPDTGLLYRSHRFYETAGIHTHTFYEFFVVTDGTALHMINHSIQHLRQGDLVFIRPWDVHTYKFSHSEDFHILNVGFSAEIFDAIQTFLAAPQETERLIRAEYPPIVNIQGEHLEQVVRSMEKIWTYMRSGSPQRAVLYTKGILSLFLSEYFFSHSAPPAPPQTSAPKWLLDLLFDMQKIENLREGFPRMIRLAAVSPSHLCRVMKRELGITPTQYVNNKRLEYAMYLLTETEEDILSVCDLCGFRNLSHFYHLFSQQYKTTPKNVRRGKREGSLQA